MTHSRLPRSTLASLFFKTGCYSFGGWSSTLVQLERRLKHQSVHLTDADYKIAVGYAQLIPGATQVSIVTNIGYKLGGGLGACIAMLSYLLPSFILVLAFAYLYFDLLRFVRFDQYSAGLVAGLSGIILANGYRIGLRFVHARVLWVAIGFAAITELILRPNPIFLILLYALTSLSLHLKQRRGKSHD